ncbi:ABC transporter permease [bacterium]|nr:ABC transporter permease [bacterium]
MKSTHKNPPRWIKWLLLLQTNQLDRYSLLDDMNLEYHDIIIARGHTYAYIWYLSSILQAVSIFTLDIFYWRIIMIKNYLKVTLRNIKKAKGYSFINIFGLAVGMACCILILAFIVDEMSFDHFHEKADNIYRVATKGQIAGRTIEVATVPIPMGPAMIRDFPEVINAVRFRSSGSELFSYKDKKFLESEVLYADNSLFDVFSFKLLSGDPATALKTAFSIVITQEIAQKYFGSEEALGKILTVGNQDEYTVTGIIEKLPTNSHIQFEVLASLETLFKLRPQIDTWMSWNYQTYIELREGVEYKAFEQKFDQFNDKYIGGFISSIGGTVKNYLQPLKSIHLHSNLENELSPNSDIRYVYTFIAIAVFILIIACINFMNLSTARSAKRAKEVGLRKVVGAERGMLIQQFLGESISIATISLFISLIMVRIALPYFNQLAHRQLDISFILHPWMILGIISIILLVGIIAGIYPAFFLSGFSPVSVLKGEKGKGAKNSRLRSLLVIFQFTISITLIIGTTVVLNQLTYMKNKTLGFNKEQLLIIPIIDSETARSVELIKSELNMLSGVISTSSSMQIPGGNNLNASVYIPEGSSQDQSLLMENFYVDEHFLDTYQIELAEGRNFNKRITTDQEQAILINEATVKKLGWKNPLGKKISEIDDNDPQTPIHYMTVVGVIKDIHHRSLHHTVEPTIIEYRPSYGMYLSIKLQTEAIFQTMSQIEKKWDLLSLSNPFDYFFFNDHYNQLYNNEERLANIFKSFTLFAVIIGCLGLFGLASFAAEQRTKEIGIRKVLGSSTSAIMLILCKEFVYLILIANIVAWPIAYFTMRNWLSGFPYQAQMSIITFIVAGSSALLIALLTVSYRALTAAHANPVKALKYD